MVWGRGRGSGSALRPCNGVGGSLSLSRLWGPCGMKASAMSLCKFPAAPDIKVAGPAPGIVHGDKKKQAPGKFPAMYLLHCMD